MLRIKLKQKECKDFVRTLLLDNMSSYYEDLGVKWSDDIFEQSWNELETFVISFRRFDVGYLRISFDADACYVRDLQIKRNFQNQGIGALSLEECYKIALAKGFTCIRLRVFKSNPAQGLYKRCGFKIVSEDESIVQMERRLA